MLGVLITILSIFCIAHAKPRIASEQYIIYEPSNSKKLLALKAGNKIKKVGSKSYSVKKKRNRNKSVVYSKKRNPCNKIKKIPGLKCEPDFEQKIDLVPSDYYYSIMWHLHHATYGINAPSAWDITTGSSDVVIGVLDTGTLTSHPDLAANLWVNPGEIASNSIDDDGNGYVDDIYGINAILDNANVTDDNGHGTHVAGTIGAVSNSDGVVGVTWNVKIVTGKFLGSDGRGWTSDAIEALDYMNDLKDDGLNIVAINHSWGGGGYSASLYNEITRSQNLGILHPAAAGNGGEDYIADDNDSTPHYPSSYNHDAIISVANLTSSGVLSSSSNYGATSVDIAAPGTSIASTYHINPWYVYMSGTSMATPVVTGIVALIASEYPHLSYSEIKNCITSSIISIPALPIQFPGTVDAEAALNCAASVATPTYTPTPLPTNTATNTPIPPTPTNTPLPTNTPTFTNTPLPTPTNTPTNPAATSTPTNTPLPTNTPTFTNTPLPTSTNTPLPTNTPTFTNTALPTPTSTPTSPAATSTPTNSPTSTPTFTSTPLPTNTSTNTPIPPTPTNTPLQTSTPTFTNTPSETPTPTSTPIVVIPQFSLSTNPVKKLFPGKKFKLNINSNIDTSGIVQFSFPKGRSCQKVANINVLEGENSYTFKLPAGAGSYKKLIVKFTDQNSINSTITRKVHNTGLSTTVSRVCKVLAKAR